MNSSKPVHVARDERAVERAAPLELGGQRPGQHHVGARAEREVQVGLLGDLGAPGSTTTSFAPVAAGLR